MLENELTDCKSEQVRKIRNPRSEGLNRRKDLKLKLLADLPFLEPYFEEEKMFLKQSTKNTILALHPKVWPLIVEDYRQSEQHGEAYIKLLQ